MYSQSIPDDMSSRESPIMSVGIPHACSTFSMPRRSEPRDSSMVLPFSWVTVRAISSKFSSSNDLNLKRYLARWTTGVSRHFGNASRAARTASLTSVVPHMGTLPSDSPVAGLVSSYQLEGVGASHSPPTKLRTVCTRDLCLPWVPKVPSVQHLGKSGTALVVRRRIDRPSGAEISAHQACGWVSRNFGIRTLTRLRFQRDSPMSYTIIVTFYCSNGIFILL